MVDLGLISGFFQFSWVFIEHVSFGASPFRTSVASIPARVFFFFCVMSLLKKHMIVDGFPIIFLRNDYNLSSNRGTTYKTGILDPIKLVGALNP